MTKEEFIEKSTAKHGDKYDYSKVEYVNGRTKVCIVCPKHGEFWQIPRSHLIGFGCKKCGHNTLTFEEFLERAENLHGKKYTYLKEDYENETKKIRIICPVHGEFLQSPKSHIRNGKPRGCPKCSKTHVPTTEEWILKAKSVHGDKYDYSKTEYISAHKKVCIICPKHGEFWQEPDNHVRWGCRQCKESSLESDVRNMLEKKGIQYEEQKVFPWLKHKGYLKIDFFLPEYNIAIECQGEQHFETFRFEKNVVRLKNRNIRDKIKKEKCFENGIKLLYYGVSKKYDICLNDKIIKSTDELYKNIIKYGNNKN